MKDLPAGFEELTANPSTREGGLFIRIYPFTTSGGTGYNAAISKELHTALGKPARVKIAVNPEDGKIIIHALEVGGFRVHSAPTTPRISAAPLVKAGLPLRTRIYFTGQDGVYVSEATK